MNKLGLSLFVGMIIGCVTHSAVEPLVVPPAIAKNIPKWEYFCFSETDALAKSKKLKNYDKLSLGQRLARGANIQGNALGKQGWEPVGLGGAGPGNGAIMNWCFKRPL